MAAPSDYYVDPENGDDDTGDGLAPGTAWQTLQHALDNITQDTTNGDRIYLEATTEDVLAGALSLTTYGTPASGYPLMIVGRNGRGVVNCATYALFAVQPSYVYLNGLEIYTTGAVDLVYVGSYCHVLNCVIHGGSVAVHLKNNYAVLSNCYVYGASAYAVSLEGFGNIIECCYLGGSVYVTQSGHVLRENAIAVSGSLKGVNINSIAHQYSVLGNSIWSNGGSGSGIYDAGANGGRQIDNIISGFTSGYGIDGAGTEDLAVRAYNAVYNCGTSYNTPGSVSLLETDNEELSSDPFADPANGDFTLADTGNVKGGAYPAANLGAGQSSSRSHLDKGAVQRQEPAGGGARSLMVNGFLRGGI